MSLKGPSKNVDTRRLVTATINLTKNLVGSSIFSLPIALYRGSVGPGLLTIMLAGAFSASSFWLIALLCQKVERRTYRGIWCAAFGDSSGWMVDLSIATNGFFVCVSYIILITDFLESGLTGLFDWQHTNRLALISSFSVVGLIPLSLAKDLSALRYTSTIGIVIVVMVFLFIVMDCYTNWDIAKGTLQSNSWNLNMGIFSTLAIATGGFKAHYNAPRFYDELAGSLPAFTRMVLFSFTMALTFYMIFAVAGLGRWGDSVLGNVLKNYPAEGCMPILLASIGMEVIFTYPLIFTTARESIIGLVPALQRANRSNPHGAHTILTIVLVLVTSLVACCIRDVSLVIGLCGATIGSCLCWIFPAMIYLKLVFGKRKEEADVASLEEARDLEETRDLVESKRARQPAEQIKPSSGLIGLSLMLVVAGSVSMVVSLATTLGVL
eukprot:TRINITY_DN8975_c0_g1_i1.p1 TRINITY_DN8975_c0_g1~~TRINITY_DN8975_c0_g1_i1.p1  ORF type:complete len:438 (+),score=43.22 TRINITY_DN8975_c0_g1_i1:74-1387(+)